MTSHLGSKIINVRPSQCTKLNLFESYRHFDAFLFLTSQETEGE